MMKRPQALLRGSFIVAGLALATLAVQHALNVDSAALVAPDPAGAAAGPQRAGAVFAPPGSAAGRLLGPAAGANFANAARRSGPTMSGAPNEPELSSRDPFRDVPYLDLLRPDTAQPEAKRPPMNPGVSVRIEAPPSTANPTARSGAWNTTAGPADQCGPQTIAVQPQGVTANVEFVGVLLNGMEQNAAEFSGTQLGDLKIVVQWHHLLQNHAQRLDLIAPDGSLYQSLSRPLTVANEGADVETRVPVSGSWITRYGLYGTWCVAVYFDQDDAPVTTARVAIAR